MTEGLKLVVGLGNPGYRYYLTPHNLGFMAVDRFGESCGIEINRAEGQALTARTQADDNQVLLAKPQTYMNLSGLAVGRLMSRYQISAENLLVLVDDVNIPLGTLRIRGRGSAGGHNGLKSIIAVVGSERFARIRMGVAPECFPGDFVAYVLGRFCDADLEAVADMVDRASEAVHAVLREGLG
ncbi:MAG TPA: aminoacyl-tRNA hydrolase, partial [Terriglobia bacterium]|nr:aminoacyl-tRNA hydrolase [Terriglobia bacterium]